MPKIQTIAELKKQLSAKRKALTVLAAQRKKLAGRLAAVEKKIATLTGEAPAGKPPRKKRAKAAKKKVSRKRKVAKKATTEVKRAKKAVKKTARKPKRATGKPLVNYIKEVLAPAKEGMRAKDVAAAVVKAGYPTKSKSFYGIVAATLADTKAVKRLKRGVYALK